MPLDIAPTHLIAHLTDTHFLAGGAPLYGTVDTVEHLQRALRRLESSDLRIDAIVHTGDITDLGELDAYQRVRAILEPAAERLSCPIVWVPGNHDVRGALRQGLLSQEPSDAPLDAVTEVRGLRIVTLDTSVPQAGYGEVDRAQLDWLRHALAAPAPEGTLLALHHPPLHTTVRVLDPFQLRGSDALADVVEGTDVRAILAGHFHYGLGGRFAGVPVTVAPALSYNVRVEAPELGYTGVDGQHAISLTAVYPDRIASILLPIDEPPVVVHLPDRFFES